MDQNYLQKKYSDFQSETKAVDFKNNLIIGFASFFYTFESVFFSNYKQIVVCMIAKSKDPPIIKLAVNMYGTFTF